MSAILYEDERERRGGERERERNVRGIEKYIYIYIEESATCL